jgi:hypothetical protein
MDRTETKDKSERLIKPCQEEAAYANTVMQRHVTLRPRKPIPSIKTAVPNISPKALSLEVTCEPYPKMSIFLKCSHLCNNFSHSKTST